MRIEENLHVTLHNEGSSLEGTGPFWMAVAVAMAFAAVRYPELRHWWWFVSGSLIYVVGGSR